MPHVHPIKERVITEGADIYCERRGNDDRHRRDRSSLSRPLILLIHGAMEDAGYYSSVADILAEKYTVVTYDRQCNSRSSGDRGVDMTVAQQARDAASVIKAMGYGKAVVVGRSGGAIIGRELTATMPEAIDFLIAHEAPAIEILPNEDAEKWRSFVNNIYKKNVHEGWEAAQAEFMKSLINVPNTPLPPDLNERLSGNADFFFKHELRAIFGYFPNIKSIKNSNVQMVTAVGKDSDNAYDVQATKTLAAKIGCKYVEFPGHHDASFWMPEEFANVILQTLERHGHC